MKRRAETLEEDSSKRPRTTDELQENVLEMWRDTFHESDINELALQSVTTVGSDYTSTDPNEMRKVTHVFLNSVKEENVKASNQEASGRCWMFAAGNMFRHNIIRALGIRNFEFSMTYLFFFDKLERANYFLLEAKKTLGLPSEDRYVNYIFSDCMEDGGLWNIAANLIDKYGLVPKDAMPETFQSVFSSDMNSILIRKLHGAAIAMRKIKNPTNEKLETIRETCMHQIYDTLTKFLGEPPKKFEWSFYSNDGDGHIIRNLTPSKFKSLTLPDVKLSDDFVILSNYPQKPYFRTYEIQYSAGVQGGKPYTCVNLPIHELKKYAIKMLLDGPGHAVWFSADVSVGMSFEKSALNDSLFNYERVFGKSYPLAKKDISEFQTGFAGHAMTLVGVDIDHVNRPIKWQVENSWGFSDNEEPGEDGFLSMSDRWFTDHVYEVIVHRSLLSRTMMNVVKINPIILTPWDTIHPAKHNFTAARFFYEKLLVCGSKK